MKEGEDQVQEVLVVQVAQEDPLAQELILILAGVIRGILITEARVIRKGLARGPRIPNTLKLRSWTCRGNIMALMGELLTPSQASPRGAPAGKGVGQKGLAVAGLPRVQARAHPLNRDRLGHQGDTVATLHIPGVMVAIPLILKATPKENEVQVLDQVTHRRDTVVPDLTQTAPLPPAQTVPKTLNLTPLTPGSILQINPLLQVITPTAPLPLLANTRVPPPQPGRPPSITAPLDQRDLPTPYPHPDHPLKRKGDSLGVTMVDQRVQNQG